VLGLVGSWFAIVPVLYTVSFSFHQSAI